jgi:calcineurin-like phosphoesterase family protein
MNYYFSSDWHLDHSKIIEIMDRPYESVNQMNEDIIEIYKHFVQPGDHFYFLGDLSLSYKMIEYFFNNVFSNKNHFFWILGNHDIRFKSKIKKLEEKIQNLHVYDLLDIKINDQNIALCHYPMLTWDKSHYNSYQLFGHHHLDYAGKVSNKVSKRLVGKQFNVSLDLNYFRMLSFWEINSVVKDMPNNWDYFPKEVQRIGGLS